MNGITFGRSDQKFIISCNNKNIGNRTGIKTKRTISSRSYMVRIQNAKSASQVSSVIMQAKSDAAFVRMSGASESEIKKAMQIIDNAIASGRIKTAALNKEKRMEQEKRSASLRRKIKIEQELSKKRRTRKAKEQADTLNDDSVTITKNEADETGYDCTDSLGSDTMTEIDVSTNQTSYTVGGSIDNIEAGSGTIIDINV